LAIGSLQLAKEKNWQLAKKIKNVNKKLKPFVFCFLPIANCRLQTDL
jgi:hypothetical protein